ncbi:MAG: hypothetical protein ACSW8F_06480, partial [bacterium]
AASGGTSPFRGGKRATVQPSSILFIPHSSVFITIPHPSPQGKLFAGFFLSHAKITEKRPHML